VKDAPFHVTCNYVDIAVLQREAAQLTNVPKLNTSSQPCGVSCNGSMAAKEIQKMFIECTARVQ
jgi:hypothetical protein